MDRKYVMCAVSCICTIVAGAALALSVNSGKQFDNYSNPDAHGVCYGQDLDGISLSLEDTVVVLNGFRVCPLIPRQVEKPMVSEP